ncbi:MAG TPA: toll/interleukin-1 receptor domain-containing protein [Actinomycetes bacterium]|nr:toll/interleukin-1 receptor domain-containing protein [Actinomycetes bacterium]
MDWPETHKLTALVDGVVGAVNAQEDDPQDHVEVRAADCLFFGWESEQLPVGTTVAQVPEPGVVVAVHLGGENVASQGLMLGIRSSVMQNDTYGPRLRRFLRGPDATRPAAPLFHFDAFVSYSAQDGPFAASLVGALRAFDVACFLAEMSLAAGRLWAEQLRAALLSSRAGVILLTPQSAHSDWVQAEVGAMWALRRPVIPTVVGLEPNDMPTSLRALLPHAVIATDVTDTAGGAAQALAAQLAPIVTGIRESGDVA